MTRRLLWLALLGAALGAGLGLWRARQSEDPLEKRFPEASLRNAVEGARISILSNLSDKTAAGDVLWAEAVTPGPLQTARWEPTCLSLLKSLLRRNPGADWICLFLAEDSALAATSNWLAMAEFHHGRVTLRGGHPSPAQLDSLSSLGTPARRPTPEEAALIQEVFSAHSGLRGERWRLSQSLRGATAASLNRGEFFRLDLDTRKLADIGRKRGMDGGELRGLALAVTRYYWLNLDRTESR